MFPEDTLNLGSYVEVTAEIENELTLLHSGDVACRKLEGGKVWYHIKPSRGKSLWYSHGEILGTEKIADLITREDENFGIIVEKIVAKKPIKKGK